jgi:hypothetical protein
VIESLGFTDAFSSSLRVLSKDRALQIYRVFRERTIQVDNKSIQINEMIIKGQNTLSFRYPHNI